MDPRRVVVGYHWDAAERTRLLCLVHDPIGGGVAYHSIAMCVNLLGLSREAAEEQGEQEEDRAEK